MIIDANNLILGRMGTYIAKKALLGEKVDIINCENSVISGKRHEIIAHYRKLFKRGIPRKGPFYYKMPNMFVRRTIRGMLPYKKERGKEAYKNIKCYIGIPENLDNQKFETIKNANVEKLPHLKYTKVSEICTSFGAKIK